MEYNENLMSTLKPHSNLWIECDGRVVLSKWRVRLLEAIQGTGSISAAARRVDVAYPRAWDKLDEMEKGLGVRLVERQVGGARLTAAGCEYVARFKRFVRDLDDVITGHFEQAFGDR